MQTQIELKKTIKELNTKREDTLTAIGETIRLAAKAGSIIAVARAEGENMRKLLDYVGLTDEQGKRLERVYRHEHKLASGDPGAFRQIMLWSEMSPDPITTSVPTEPKSFLLPVIKFSQWLNNKCMKKVRQDERLRDQFLEEATPIVQAYKDLGGSI
jgi:hypothetical protein